MKRKNLMPAILFMVLGLPVFAQQPDPTLIPFRQGNLWGYAHPDRSIAIKPSFVEAKWFFSGFAAVKKGSKFGYINPSGKMVIPYRFYNAKSFHYGYFDSKEKHEAGGKTVQNADSVLFAGASLSATDIEHCIDTKGRIMTKCPSINDNTAAINQHSISVSSEKVYSLVNNAGLYDKLVDDYMIPGDDHTYYIGVKNNLFGVVNNTFDVVVPFTYTSLKKANIGGAICLQASKNGLYGMLKGNGAEMVPVEKSKLELVQPKNGATFIIEAKDGRVGLRDGSLQVILDARYSDIVYDEEGGFLLNSPDNLKGVYFLNGKAIQPRYKEARLMRGGKFLEVTTASGKLGYVNDQGVEFFTD